MKFFIPASKSIDQAEEVYNSIIKFCESQFTWKVINRRIFKINFKHDGKYYEAEVGKIEKRTNDIIIAILETDTVYYVCTRYRGVIRGEPILVGKNEITYIEDFDK